MLYIDIIGCSISDLKSITFSTQNSNPKNSGQARAVREHRYKQVGYKCPSKYLEPSITSSPFIFLPAPQPYVHICAVLSQLVPLSFYLRAPVSLYSSSSSSFGLLLTWEHPPLHSFFSLPQRKLTSLVERKKLDLLNAKKQSP